MTKEKKFTSLSRTELSENVDDGYTIHGVAIGEGDVTRGQSGTKKVWKKEPLKEAVDSLRGKPIVVDHNNTSDSVIGKINKAKYEEDVGVLYEGEIHDEDLSDKISNGLLEVSLRGHHESEEEMERDDETGALAPKNILFENISVVPKGAAPSNTVNIGEHDELATAALSQYFENEKHDYEEGDYVSWADGDVTAIVRDVSGETLTVQVHTEDDNQGEASGQEIEVSVDQVSSTENLSSSVLEVDNDSDEETEELAEYTIHTPEYSGTTEGEWNKPSLNDFTDESWDDLSNEEKSDIGDHFIMSSSGFPADNFGDMNLPVVTPQGNLSISALRTVKGGRGVQSVEGASAEDESRVMSMVNRFAKEEFDKDWSDEEEMAFNEPSEYEIQEPEYSGTTEGSWDSPMLKDLTDKSWSEMSDSEKEDISDHFMLTAGSFPPEKFRWLKLAAVEPNGDLNLNGLKAIKGGHGASAVDYVSDEDKLKIMRMADDLASKEFGENWETREEDLASHEVSNDADAGKDENASQTISVFENGLTYNTTMTDIDTDGMDNPVAIEEEELQSLRDENEELKDKADTVEELNDTLSELRDNQEILDDVDSDALEELRETDEPVVMSESKVDELQNQVEQVKQIRAEELASEYDLFDADELAEKYTIEELNEKVESVSDDDEDETEEELSPDPKSNDGSSEDETETEELSDDESEKQDTLEELGWAEYAE